MEKFPALRWLAKLPGQTNLSLAGVEPAKIDSILLTHAHSDHVEELVDTAGRIACSHGEISFIFLISRFNGPTYRLHSTKTLPPQPPHDRGFWTWSVRRVF
ncbi:MBL fold metallo-hydrolase [Paraburkholderia silvatlantica]|uniref:MBL fold metallo-hydrolase n=1 Tax=Paraburkholderia silvatlantica TaxID=321895 RepID=UPI0035A09C50